MTAWSERWIPDAFVFALLATVVVVVAAVVATPTGVVDVAWLKAAGGTEAFVSAPAVRHPLSWFEPVLLTCGVAGLYNLMKVLDTRFADPK